MMSTKLCVLLLIRVLRLLLGSALRTLPTRLLLLSILKGLRQIRVLVPSQVSILSLLLTVIISVQVLRIEHAKSTTGPMFTPYGDLPTSPAVAASKDASEDVAVNSGFYSPLAGIAPVDGWDSDVNDNAEFSMAVCDVKNCDLPVYSAQHMYCSPSCRVDTLLLNPDASMNNKCVALGYDSATLAWNLLPGFFCSIICRDRAVLSSAAPPQPASDPVSSGPSYASVDISSAMITAFTMS